MNKAVSSGREPVTAVIARLVKPDRQEDFEKGVRSMGQVAGGFAGYLGTDVIRPRNPSHLEYVMIARFEGYENLRAFMESTQRRDWLKKSESLTIGQMHIQEAHGFEPWFDLPRQSGAAAPPAKYKMALLTILALYPSLLALSTILTFLVHGWPSALLMLLTVAILVPLMTYLIMPWITHVFRRWLYPDTAAS